MFLLEGLAACAAKQASASTVAHVATGLGITVAGVTGAGAAGILPGAGQDGVAGAIESVSPFDLPDSGHDLVTVADDDATDAAGADDSGGDGDGASPTDIPGAPTPTPRRPPPPRPTTRTTMPTRTTPSTSTAAAGRPSRRRRCEPTTRARAT